MSDRGGSGLVSILVAEQRLASVLVLRQILQELCGGGRGNVFYIPANNVIFNKYNK